ncbi:MAG: mannonate dehydratase, partial [Planctomycetaceae bacterium]|nr:mannonate dehydratase [Planctomycetaceae bacterium]
MCFLPARCPPEHIWTFFGRQVVKFTSVVTPFTDENLRLVSQVGVTHVTIRYPGPGLDELAKVKKRVQGFGLDIAAIEGYLPIENIKLGNELFGQDVEEMKLLLANMEQVGIPVACYNFMAGTDWVRTKLDIPERGGAWVTGFNLAEAEKAVSLRDDVEEIGGQTISAEELWINLERFLKEILPTA